MRANILAMVHALKPDFCCGLVRGFERGVQRRRRRSDTEHAAAAGDQFDAAVRAGSACGARMKHFYPRDAVGLRETVDALTDGEFAGVTAGGEDDAGTRSGAPF